jgi:hypothetical protein
LPVFKTGRRLKTYPGAHLSEVLNAKVISSENSGVSRRRVVAGVAWSLPVIATAIAAPAAAASPGPTPPPVTPASASLSAGTQNITSTVSAAHERANVTVPATINLKDLSGVTGSIGVVLTISPQPAVAGAPSVTLSSVRVGATSVTVTPSNAGTTFTANFSYTLPVGATTLDFLLGGYSYSGKKQDEATYAVTTLITIQERGVTKQLTPGSAITLVKM